MSKKIFGYFFNKLAAASFSFALFTIIILFSSDFDLYKFTNDVSYKHLAFIFFVYGICCSSLIDLLGFKITQMNKTGIKAVLYAIAGAGFFFALSGINILSIFAASIGSIFALFFYFGTYLAKRSKAVTIGLAAGIPILFTILLSIDFTVKRNWVEVKEPSSFEASFQYFNGEHRIPIKARKGQEIFFTIDLENKNGGGHGYHVKNKYGTLQPMEEVLEKEMKMKVKKNGTYFITITADNLEGRYKVNWEVADK